MPEIDFQPEKRTIEELFVGADYFVIPRFQRPYSWEDSNLDDFWRDVVFDNPVGYFIGPMVAWREPGSPIRRVVDGQQRLTTISILFSVLRDQFARLGEAKLAEGVHRYLEKADRDNEKHFTLQTESPSTFLDQSILKHPPERDTEPRTEEEIALGRALQSISRLVDSEVRKRSSPVVWLTQLRDTLLGLRVIWIEHSSEDDAYVIFETLNSRGKDLEVVDLLKNHLFSKLRGTGNAAADTTRTKWEKMRNTLDQSESRPRLDPNRFILHWWLSKEDYVGERKLFREIKGKIKTKPLAKVGLDSLTSDASLYRIAIDPSSHTWPIEELKAKRALEALEVFGITQPSPLLLALIRARTSTPKLGAAQFCRTLQVIERFHFQHTVVSQLRSSGGVSEMYAKAARELHAAGTNQQHRANALDEIRRKLIERAPDEEQFMLSFEKRFHFTNERTRDAKLVRHVLTRFLHDHSPTTSLDGLTIEHLIPQRMARGEQPTPIEVIGSIGNLVLVSESLNSKLADRDFSAKKRILARDGQNYAFGGVLGHSSFGADDVAKRTRLLGEMAYRKIWKLPT